MHDKYITIIDICSIYYPSDGFIDLSRIKNVGSWKLEEFSGGS
jgi:hypothetical protein